MMFEFQTKVQSWGLGAVYFDGEIPGGFTLDYERSVYLYERRLIVDNGEEN